MKLYFARHGQTDANVRMINSQSDIGVDEPLNKTGLEQAKNLAEELKDVKFDVIISSPLIRASQTAEQVNKYHNLPIQINESWQERKIKTNVDSETWNDLFDFDKNLEIENVENLKQFFERVYSAVEDLKSKYRNSTVLVVSHGGVQHALSAYASNSQLKGNIRISPMGNCEYRIFEFSS